jgi:hypothetical protein
MQPHQILRAAAVIVETGWCQGCGARDELGREVSLFSGDARATVNPAATSFSAYGAICKAMAVSRSGASQAMWIKLRELAQGAGSASWTDYNNAEGRTAAEVVTLPGAVLGGPRRPYVSKQN